MEHGKLNVVLCWHMHQPWYREGLEGEYILPWVYLHAIKDYSDMAAHLEQHRSMNAVVNFAPVLLEQLEDYARQIRDYLTHGMPMQDHLLNQLAGIEPIPATDEGRRQLMVECQRCNGPRMIDPYPAFRQLLAASGAPEIAKNKSGSLLLEPVYLSEQYFIDLLVWYHLVWLGQSLRQLPEVVRLFEKGRAYSQQDRHDLLKVMQACMEGLVPRYRALAESGQVELSMSPYMHPIVPLLQDFGQMRCSQPDDPLPETGLYPGGSERAVWHLQQGIAVFERFFGFRPEGVWLSEGAVSESALRLLQASDIRWTASGEGVWRSSCHLSGLDDEGIRSKRDLFRPYQLEPEGVRLFFRDDGLSDLIGFKYSDWGASDAAGDFVHHLESITRFMGDEASQRVVPIILDGENAWEYYPDNGSHFLSALYERLSQSPLLAPTHFRTMAAQLPGQHLPKICAGSWVYGSFSTWIGSPDKNRGWDLLVEAKHCLDRVLADGQLKPEQHEKILRQLGVCEGSDWFWWFGDYNPADSVRDFEGLYRRQLGRLYSLLGQTVPAALSQPVSSGGGAAENAGTMRSNT
ncbi:MAG TPA: glycoside hydrolase family 57 protein [Thiolinea sp.]|nr:glycoside hydrolase family 57 protein [Thiolinea sp.]